eukprot:m.55536 g.55536  ORF g.55536 m.55536 type:complete len:935 (-) comp11498_c0_seq1:358-3162(-)
MSASADSPAKKAGGKKGGKKLKSSSGSAVVSANLSNTNYDMVRQVVDELGIVTSDPDDLETNLVWSDVCPPAAIFHGLSPWQRINHFPGTGEITRKDNLARNLNRLHRAVGGKNLDMFPRSWVFPADIQLFRRYVDSLSAKKLSSKTFIYKPINGARGIGIALTKNPNDIPMTDSLLVQEYLSKPYLVDGFKFDLRLYVLLTSCSPLRIYLFRDGLVRVSTKQYKPPTAKNVSEMCMHLTNFSINKTSDDFEDTEDYTSGSKRSYQWLLSQLQAEGHDVARLERRIADIIVKTVIVALPHVRRGYKASLRNTGVERHSRCFEILGFDVFLDTKLKPYVIEVNRAPSFTCGSPLDTEIKHDVLRSALIMTKMRAKDRADYERKTRKRAQKRLYASSASPGTSSSSSISAGAAILSQTGSKESNGSHRAVHSAPLQGLDPSLSASAQGKEQGSEGESLHEKHMRFEDARSGDFSRIYPVPLHVDGAEEQAAIYDHLLQTATAIFQKATGTHGTQGSTASASAADSSATTPASAASAKSASASRAGSTWGSPSRVTLGTSSSPMRAQRARPLQNLQEERQDHPMVPKLLHHLKQQQIMLALEVAGITHDASALVEHALLVQTPSAWKEHRKRVAEYWLKLLTPPDRHRFLSTCKAAVLSTMAAIGPRKDISTMRIVRVISKVFDRLFFNNGQGIWNMFSLPDDSWESYEAVLALAHTTLLEQELVCLLVRTCKLTLVLRYLSRTVNFTAQSPPSTLPTRKLEPMASPVATAPPASSEALPLSSVSHLHPSAQGFATHGSSGEVPVTATATATGTGTAVAVRTPSAPLFQYRKVVLTRQPSQKSALSSRASSAKSLVGSSLKLNTQGVQQHQQQLQQHQHGLATVGLSGSQQCSSVATLHAMQQHLRRGHMAAPNSPSLSRNASKKGQFVKPRTLTLM